MKIYLTASTILLSATILASSNTSAEARQTGWIGLKEWNKIRRTLDKTNEIPTAVVCKGTGGVELSNKSGVANVTLKKNTGNKYWIWGVGYEYGMAKRRAARLGYTQVSHSEFRRPSGLLIRCGIWHK